MDRLPLDLRKTKYTKDCPGPECRSVVYQGGVQFRSDDGAGDADAVPGVHFVPGQDTVDRRRADPTAAVLGSGRDRPERPDRRRDDTTDRGGERRAVVRYLCHIFHPYAVWIRRFQERSYGV